ncbi:MAG: hypothetical protein J5916_03380 [Oscillospiraceae bacterium]|nr:hypothetical protein [Oscillospiraceae bacterium]
MPLGAMLMALMIGFFGGAQVIWYIVAFGLLICFWVFAASGQKKEALCGAEALYRRTA